MSSFGWRIPHSSPRMEEIRLQRRRSVGSLSLRLFPFLPFSTTVSLTLPSTSIPSSTLLLFSSPDLPTMVLDAKILAMQDKKAQDVEILRTLSMNLWRRINAGYNIPRRKPESITHQTYKYRPEALDEVEREYFHKRDAFTEYSDAVARFSQMVEKPKKAVPKYVPHKIKAELAAKAIAEKKAKNQAILQRKMTGKVVPSQVAPPPKK